MHPVSFTQGISLAMLLPYFMQLLHCYTSLKVCYYAKRDIAAGGEILFLS